jgi:hypothetical protein
METLPDILAALGRTILWNVVPWALGTFGVVAVLSATPFGKALLFALNNRGKDTELLEFIARDLAELHQLTLDISERLDATEHRLAQGQMPPLSPQGESDPARRTATPH